MRNKHRTSAKRRITAAVTSVLFAAGLLCGTQSPADAAPTESGTITFSEFGVGTRITDQYRDHGVIFTGQGLTVEEDRSTPFINPDGSNPTSPVLSGDPLFQGPITGVFTDPATNGPFQTDGFSLDVGYIDNRDSVEIAYFDIDGNKLGAVTANHFGINHMTVSHPGIARFTVHAITDEPAGFAIDNVQITGYVPGTFGPGWPNNDKPFTLKYVYDNGRYADHVDQAAEDWNDTDTNVSIEPWERVPERIHLRFEDVTVADTYWGMTLFKNDCVACVYEENIVVMNTRTLDRATEFMQTKVATHEVGHALSLMHPNNAGHSDRSKLPSVMWQGELPYNTPQEYDTDRLTKLYG
jgi:hypothetical protein